MVDLKIPLVVEHQVLDNEPSMLSGMSISHIVHLELSRITLSSKDVEVLPGTITDLSSNYEDQDTLCFDRLPLKKWTCMTRGSSVEFMGIFPHLTMLNFYQHFGQKDIVTVPVSVTAFTGRITGSLLFPAGLRLVTLELQCFEGSSPLFLDPAVALRSLRISGEPLSTDVMRSILRVCNPLTLTVLSITVKNTKATLAALTGLAEFLHITTVSISQSMYHRVSSYMGSNVTVHQRRLVSQHITLPDSITRLTLHAGDLDFENLVLPRSLRSLSCWGMTCDITQLIAITTLKNLRCVTPTHITTLAQLSPVLEQLTATLETLSIEGLYLTTPREVINTYLEGYVRERRRYLQTARILPLAVSSEDTS